MFYVKEKVANSPAYLKHFEYFFSLRVLHEKCSPDVLTA